MDFVLGLAKTQKGKDLAVVVYGFNPITPLNLAPLLIGQQVSLGMIKKAERVKHLHESVKQQSEIQLKREQQTKEERKFSLILVVLCGLISEKRGFNMKGSLSLCL